jgi:methionyl-tRNA formyltransferase
MKHSIQTVVIGCVKFSQTLLEELHSINSVEICGIVTRNHSGFNSDFVDLGTVACAKNIPTNHLVNNDQDSLVLWLEKIKPDVIFCLGWPFLLRPDVLTIPKFGVIGYHPSLLPRNRGRHPIIWSLALGLKETGSSFFLMDEGADSGSILSQERIHILDEDNAETLYVKLETIACKQIHDVVEKLRLGTFKLIPQDNRLATYWRKRNKEDGRIDWRMSAEAVHNLVRALTMPYIGAHFDYQGDLIKVWKTRLGNSSLCDIEPGFILSVNANEIHVQCGMGTSIVLEKHDLGQVIFSGKYL